MEGRGGVGGRRWGMEMEGAGRRGGAGETGVPEGRRRGYPPGWASERAVTHLAPEAAAKGCVSGRCEWW